MVGNKNKFEKAIKDTIKIEFQSWRQKISPSLNLFETKVNLTRTKQSIMHSDLINTFWTIATHGKAYCC